MNNPGPEPVAVYGAGGFAREVAWLLSTDRHHDFMGYIEDDPEEGRVLNGVSVFPWKKMSTDYRHILVAIAIGDPKSRKKVAIKCAKAGLNFATLAHHSVEMSDFVERGVGSIICCGSILTVNINIGQHAHINLDCTIGHDVRIGNFTTLSPGVHVSGNVHIGEAVYVGTGANIINGTSESPLVVADGTVIGAGACITKSTERNCLYVGVPAELKKRYA